jgi:organic radical activating enzyme
MKKIISIKSDYENVLKIFYVITTACPYSCRYCPDALHTGKNQKIDLDELKIFFEKFSDREILLNLTGGEPTQHPQFKEVVQLAKSMNIEVASDTNSVRTVRFYKEVASLVDAWNITLHPSQHILDLEKIRVLTDTSFVVVYVMMDPDFWDISMEWLAQVSQLTNIKVIPLYCMSDWGGAACTITYTQEQSDFLVNTPNILTMTPQRFEELKKTHAWLLKTDSKLTYDDNSVEVADPNMIVKLGQNNFYGWECLAGNETINIKHDGSVTWANCGIKRYNHFRDVDAIELKQPVTCNLNRCDCGADIRATKTCTK